MTARLVLFLIALTAIRVALVCWSEPSPDEAYYLACAARPAPAFFDGPGGMAAQTGLLALADDGGLAWRLAAPFWALAAALGTVVLVRTIGGDAREAGRTALLLSILPIVNAGAIRIGPGLIATSALAVALGFVWRALHATKRAMPCWGVAALAQVVAVQFAYESLAILPAIGAFLLAGRRHRRKSDVSGLALFTLLPLASLLPAFYWNAQQDWIPIAGGTFRTLWSFDPAGFTRSLGLLVLLFSPLLLPAMIATCLASARDARRHVAQRFVFAATIPFVLLTIYFALRGKNATTSLLLAAPLLLFGIQRLASRGERGRLSLTIAAGFAILCSLITMSMAFTAGKSWSAAAAEVRGIFLDKSAAGDEGLFLIAETAPIASIIGYHLRKDFIPPDGHPAVYVRESPDLSNQYALWPSYADFVETTHVGDEYFTEQKGENPFAGRSALYLTREATDNLPQTIRAAFEAVTLLKTINPEGKEPLYIHLCLNYQTLPL